MSNYAILDENNIVISTIEGKNQDSENTIDWEKYYENIFNKKCKEYSVDTLYNTNFSGGVPFRGNTVSIGSYYDENLDVFLFPKPFDDAVLHSGTYRWLKPEELDKMIELGYDNIETMYEEHEELLFELNPELETPQLNQE